MNNKSFRRRFVFIIMIYIVLVLVLWFIYQNTIFSHIQKTGQDSVALAEYSLLSNLEDEFSRMKLVSSTLAGSVYLQEFLAETDPSAYYEKAAPVSEIIRKSTYPIQSADSIVTFNADGTAYRFTGSISQDATAKIYQEVINGGAPVYSVVELDGTEYFCLADPVNIRSSGASTPVGHVVTLSNLNKVRRTIMELDIIDDIDTAVILNDTILLSSNPGLERQSADELERLYGSVAILPVTGTRLYAATAITGEALYYGERLFLATSFVALAALLVAIAILYRLLSKRMVTPILDKTEDLQIDLLKTQIDAHFIVNTIDCIESLSEQGENVKAATAAHNLGGLIRDMHNSEEEVNIYDELEHLRRYIAIMNIRSGDKYSVEFDADDILVEYRMPAQILQPLAENALTHGLGNKGSDCKLAINCRAEKDCVSIRITDNGTGMETDDIRAINFTLNAVDDEWEYEGGGLEGGVALMNIQKRIRARYGKAHGLTVSSIPTQSFTATIRLPYIEDK
ncbi:MAG: histidine kinase [Clostridiales bacterium]|nr:histidine kinase [Clostridiales bacterium]